MLKWYEERVINKGNEWGNMVEAHKVESLVDKVIKRDLVQALR